MPSTEVVLLAATLALVAAAVINRNLARGLVAIAIVAFGALYLHGRTRGLTIEQSIASIATPITAPLPTGGQVVKIDP